MKNFMTFVGAMVMVAGMNAQEVETVPFTRTQVNVPARVRFVKGADYSVSVASGNTDIANQLQCSVKDGILKIGYGKSLAAGEVVFDEKKGAYYYGVGVKEIKLSGSEDSGELLITFTSPAMPEFKTSSDYQAFPVKAVSRDMDEDIALNQND